MNERISSLLRNRWLMTILLALVVAVAYLPSLFNGFVSDDYDLILDRVSVLQNSDGLKQLLTTDYWWGTSGSEARHNLYRPWTSTTFWLDFHLGGLSPFVYHLSNYVVHVASTILLLFVLAPAIGFEFAVGTAALAALTPAVLTTPAWISGRTDLWAAFFVFLFLIFFRKAHESKGKGAFLGYIVAFFLGLCAKEIAIIAPVLAWALDRVSPGDPKSKINARRPRWHYWILAVPLIAYLLIRPAGLQGSSSSWWLAYPYTAEGIVRTGLDLVFPLHYAFFSESLWSTAGTRGVAFVTVWLVLLSAIVGIIWGIKRRQLWAVGGLWFGLVLIPTYVTGQAFAPIADLYAYLGLAGFWLFMLDGVKSVLLHLEPPRTVTRPVALTIFSFAVVLFGVLTFVRLPIFASNYSLASQMVKREPRSPRALTMMAAACKEAGDADGNSKWLNQAVAADPKDWRLHDNAANMYLDRGDVQGAAPHADALAELAPRQGMAQATIARFYYVAGHCDEAVQTYNLAFNLSYPTPQSLYGYGLALLCVHQDSGAVYAYQAAVSAKPYWPEAYNNLGVALENVGNFGEAAKAYETAVQQDSKMLTTWSSLAILRAKLGNAAAARKAAACYFQLNPDPEARVQFVNDMAASGVEVESP